MIWKKLTIDTSVEAVDLISEFLSEHSVEGVMIEDNVPLSEDDLKSMFVDIPLIEGENDGTAKVSCFVDDSFDIDGLKADIAAELIRLKEFINVGSAEITVGETSDDSTWQNNWKQYFKPFRLYDNIVILPTWEEFDDIRPDDIVVSIESVMAFGTGTHETTRLMLTTLLSLAPHFSSILDCGTGTGILAIAALKLGATKAVGYDIDEWSVDNARHNAVINQVDERFTPLFGDATVLDTISETFDVVMANINRNILLNDMPRWVSHMHAGSRLLLSGFYETDAQMLIEKAKELGLSFEGQLSDHEWTCLTFSLH